MAETQLETRSPLMQELGNYLPEIDLLKTETTETKETTADETGTTTEEAEAGSGGAGESDASAAESQEDAAGEEEETEEADATADAAAGSKEWPESARKRVDKLTAKLREAEEREADRQAQLEDVRRELDALKTGETRKDAVAGAEPGTSQSPLGDVWSEEDLMHKADAALNWKRWAVEHPDGGTLKLGDGKEKEFSFEEVRQILINADRLLSVEIPKRREFLSKTGAIERGLRAEFPEMFDEKSPGWKGMMDALAALPELKSRPDGLGLALMMSLGLGEMQKLREAKKSKVDLKAKGAAESVPRKPQIAPRPVTPVGGPSAPAKKPDNKDKALAEVLASGGDADALEKYFSTGG